MQKRRLGKTAIEVSAIGLGTVKFGRNEGVKYPKAFTLPDENELSYLLDCAQNLGINLLDTAPAYGSSEERLGKLLRGQRHHWVISTKVGETFIDGQSRFDFSQQAIFESVERSLKRLNTDYLDIVLVHSNGDDVRIIKEECVFTALSALKAAGKIRAYGMSTKTVAGGLLTVTLSDIAMVTYNPQCADEQAVISHAYQQQKGILIKKALASGHLHAFTVEDAMRFIFTEPGVGSVIIGTINAGHLRECVTCAEAGFLG